MKTTQLHEKAIMVRLTMRRAQMSRRDTVAEEAVQHHLNDASLVVNSKLFRNKLNPVNRAISAANAIYTLHKQLTLPWQDAGPRLIPTTLYFEYMQKVRDEIAKVDTLLDSIAPTYHQHVAADIQDRLKSSSSNGRASLDDYPTFEEFRQRMGFDLKFSPLPSVTHAVFDVSEDDKRQFEADMQEAARAARNDAIRRMLTPTQHLVSKLSVQIGEAGGIFRDSALSNVVEGIELARKLNIDADPEIEAIIAEVAKVVTKLNTGKDLVREHAPTREAAAKKLAELDAKMRSYMSGG
jgi:hypothetical protein